MPKHSIITHLRQVHAAERAQLGELRILRDEVGIAAIAALLAQHVDATQRHGDLVEGRLRELRSGPSMRLLTQSFVAAAPKGLVDRLRPHDARACVRDAVMAEAGEIASYQLLELEALRLGDEGTAVLCEEIRAEEVATRDELMSNWNLVVDHDLERLDGSPTHAAGAELIDHLRDIHALERNAAIMLSTVLATVHDPVARARVRDHREATLRHGTRVAERLRELDSGPSTRKQAQAYAFALVKGPINLVRAERAGKDLRDMFVVEHMEQVAYAQLEVLADRAGDERTAALAAEHRAEEEAMADWLEREAARFLLESISLPTR